MTKVNMSAVFNWDEDELLTTFSDTDSEVFYSFTEDPLLISCTLYRLINESTDDKSYKYNNWSLTEHMDKILAKVTDQDRVDAEVIRSYYRSKLLVAKLRNEHFTKYRTDLLKYLTDSPKKINSKSIGMIYKLPYFYRYDMKLTEIFGSEYATVSGKSHCEGDVVLTFIDKVNNGKKTSQVHEYWFKDDEGTRVLIEVMKHNPIMNLWDFTIKNGPVNINAKFEKKHKDNLEYYVAKGWSVNV